MRFATNRSSSHVGYSTSKATWLDRVGVLLLGSLVTLAYLQSYRLHPARPHLGGSDGWWGWFDQSWYLSAARAWAAGNLDPKLHFYLPGYALLGAVFVPVLSVHAFAAVDLLCLLASMWLFSRIAVRLLWPSLPHAALAGAMIFALTSIGSPALREVWVVPWSSSGSTPFTYAAVLAALRFTESPRRSGRMFWVGLAIGAIAAFRPSDALPVGFACALGTGMAVLRPPRSGRSTLAGIGSGACGLAVSLGLLGTVYIAIYGLHESLYVQTSEGIGFEWRSIPQRWVILGLSPRPLYDEGEGLVAAFPWLPVGLAVFPVYLLFFVHSTRWLAHITVITAASLHIGVYLTYRDLYPEGIFTYENYHYYKWIAPILALYCVLFCHDVSMARFRRPVLAASVAIFGLCLLLPWRIHFIQIRPIAYKAGSDPLHMVTFQSGLTSLNDAVLVAADGSWDAIYGGKSALTIAGHGYTERLDYKLHPAIGGFFIVPLRPLLPGLASLTVDRAVSLDPKVPLLHARQSIGLAWPCWLPEIWNSCTSQPIIMPPMLALDSDIPLNGTSHAFLLGEWSAPEPNGRWTDGHKAALRVRLPTAGPLQLEMQLYAYVPAGSEPLQAEVSVGQQILARRTFRNSLPTEWMVTIPAALVGAYPALVMTIIVINPRRPRDMDSHSSDTRRLGLFFTRLRLAKPAVSSPPNTKAGIQSEEP